MRKVNLVACNFTHRWTANENFSACGAGEPAAQGRMLLGGRRAKKRASVLSTKAEKSREVLRSSIYEIVLFVVLISALYVQESDGIVCCLYVLYLNQS